MSCRTRCGILAATDKCSISSCVQRPNRTTRTKLTVMKLITLTVILCAVCGGVTCSGGGSIETAAKSQTDMHHCRKGLLPQGQPAASGTWMHVTTPLFNVGSRFQDAVGTQEVSASLPVKGLSRRALRQVDSRMAARFKANKAKADAAKRHHQQQQQQPQQFLAAPK